MESSFKLPQLINKLLIQSDISIPIFSHFTIVVKEMYASTLGSGI